MINLLGSLIKYVDVREQLDFVAEYEARWETVDVVVAVYSLLDWLLDRGEGKASGPLVFDGDYAWCRILQDMVQKNPLNTCFFSDGEMVDYKSSIPDEQRT